MARTVEEANKALHGLGQLPYGLARTSAVLREVDQIEAEGPPQAFAHALIMLVDAYEWSDEASRAPVPFARLLAWYDSHPEHFDEADRRNFFRILAGMASQLRCYPAISRGQIEQALADLETRFAAAGLPDNAVAFSRFDWARHIDDPRTDELFNLWRATPVDEFAPCPSCAPTIQGAHLLANGAMDEGIDLLTSALDERMGIPGFRWCKEEPRDLLSVLQLAYLRRDAPGDGERAARVHQRGLYHLGDERFAVNGVIGAHLAFLAEARQGERALRLLRQSTRFLKGCATPLSSLDFLSRVSHTTLILARDLGLGGASIKTGVDGVDTVEALQVWSEAAARELAQAFDDRNQATTPTAMRRFEESLAMPPRGERLDLSLAPAATAIASAGPAGPADLADSARPTDPAQPTAPDQHTGSTWDAAAGEGAAGPPQPPATAPADLIEQGRQLVKQAEGALSGGDPGAARSDFLRAAKALEEAGLLGEAGFAMAEAAIITVGLGDENGALSEFVRAVNLLTAAGVEIGFVSPVARSHARALAQIESYDEAVTVVEWAAQAIELRYPSADGGRTEQVEREALAVADTKARILCTAGRYAEGAQLARQVASQYAGLGAIRDAAYAFHLAGQAYAHSQEWEAAIWCLESATEGFGIAHERALRAEAISDLEPILRRLGRDDDADNLLG